MFANGPQCTNAGWPSSVCTRFGMIASLSRTAIEPAQPICSAVTGSPARLYATVIAPSRWRRSGRSRASARIAMTSEAAVMSKPVSRGEPFVAPPRPVMMLRRPRSFMSTQRRQRDRVRVDVELVAVHHVRVEERREQVVGGRDRVHVAGEVEVQILHRHDLRVAGAGGAALDAEDGAERGLADAQREPSRRSRPCPASARPRSSSCPRRPSSA